MAHGASMSHSIVRDQDILRLICLASQTICYHVYTIWLFTRSDLKTIVFPATSFAVVCASAGWLFPPALLNAAFARKTLMTGFWVWINLLPFTIENQRQQDSIQEDMQNKPWRPLPSKRLKRDRELPLMLAFYIMAGVYSYFFGGVRQCLALVILGYWYNELNGGDHSCSTRQMLNALGYMSFTSGALEVISEQPFDLFPTRVQQWVLMMGAVIFTTVQAQDMSDQAGDGVRGRRTIPLIWGDRAARWSIALMVGTWSFLCPAFWSTDFTGSIMTWLLGSIVIVRFLSKDTVAADKASFRIYNVWVVSLYLLPWFSDKAHVFSGVESH